MTVKNRRAEIFNRTSKSPRVRAAAAPDGAAEVYLYDAIGWSGVTAKDVARELRTIDAEHIVLRINSPGGDVFEGIAIANLLRAHKATVTAVIDGLAASAASFIAVTADEVVMSKNSELMIHDAWGVCVGPSDDMRSMADDLDRVSNNIASMYAERGGTTEQWREAMLAETWYSAQEAVDAGLADRVDGVTDEAAKNRYDLSVFAHAGRANAPRPLIPGHPDAQASTDPSTAPAAEHTRPAAQASRDTTTQEGSTEMQFTSEQITALRNAVGVADDADGATLVAAVKEALAEQAEPTPQAQSTTQTPTVPEGTVLIAKEQLEPLLAAAEELRVENARKADEELRRTVAAAVADGRISPANAEGWVARIKADSAERAVLDSLAPGLTVPLTEQGIATAENSASGTAEDDEYLKYFPTTKTEA